MDDLGVITTISGSPQMEIEARAGFIIDLCMDNCACTYISTSSNSILYISIYLYIYILGTTFAGDRTAFLWAKFWLKCFGQSESILGFAEDFPEATSPWIC